jgi:hypothetical protein
MRIELEFGLVLMFPIIISGICLQIILNIWLTNSLNNLLIDIFEKEIKNN